MDREPDADRLPGEADFRYVYTDELHAKAFIADLEQALAGSQWIGKSVAPLYATITLPAAGGTANMDVEEFAGFAAFRVFVDGDLVRLRQFDRSLCQEPSLLMSLPMV